MPLYEYKCADCKLQFEVRQKFSDAPIASCRQCGGQVKKLISQTAFTLRGGGWYQEGYVQSSSDSKKKESTVEKSVSKPSTPKKETAPCSKVANG